MISKTYKTVAVILDGQASVHEYQHLFDRAREATGCRSIVCLMQGSFSDTALPLEQPAVERAKKLYAAGADLIIEVPCICTLLTGDINAFALSALMQRTTIIDAFILPCLEEEQSLIRQASDMLFFEPQPYQRALKALRSKGYSLEDYQFSKMIPYLSEDTQALSKGYVRLEAYMLCALKKTYSLVKPVFLSMDKDSMEKLYPDTQAFSSSRDRDLYEQARKFFTPFSSQETSSLNNLLKDCETIYGSSATMLKILDTLLRSDPADSSSFEDLSHKAEMLCAKETYKKTAREFRRLLCYLISDYRFALNSILALRTYVPYIHILASENTDPTLVEDIRKGNWAPVIEDDILTGKSKDDITLLDETLQDLYEIERIFE